MKNLLKDCVCCLWQPDISKYSNELLPLLFGYLSEATREAAMDPRSVTKSYYALEMFCENLGKKIVSFFLLTG